MSCAVDLLRLAGGALDEIWGPLVRQGLLDRIPRQLSARIVRRLADRTLTLPRAHLTLDGAVRFRRRLPVLSTSEETLEAVWEQQLRITTPQQGAPTIMYLGAVRQLDTIERFGGHQGLRPARLQLIPDGRSHVPGSRSTPEGCAHYESIPSHLRGMGTTERIEMTTITSRTGTPAEQIAGSIREKMAGGQLDTPLVVQNQPIPGYGTIIVNVPTDLPPLTRVIADDVHDLLRAEFARRPSTQRFLFHQGDTWFGGIRTSPDAFEVRAY